MKSYQDIFQSSKKTTTKRLILRILQKSDINYDYVEALNNESIVGMTEARHTKWTKKKIEDYINLNNNSPSMLLIGVFLKENNIHLGNIRLSNISRIHKRTEISMLFYRKDYWNKGIATEALEQVINLTFSEIRLRRICADYFENNYASKRIFEKLGFIVEGIYKEHFYNNGNFINSVRVALMQ